jgi:hypothetical protein
MTANTIIDTYMPPAPPTISPMLSNQFERRVV